MPPVGRLDKSSELAETIKTLSINTDPPRVTSTKPKDYGSSSVADSWDQEDRDEVAGLPTTSKSSLPYTQTSDAPIAPPPTPISPSTYGDRDQHPTSVPSWQSTTESLSRDPDKRPEKSTAVANRLIAGALGVRAPKRTEEQRKYDRAVKEQEIRKKNREKEDLKRKQEEAEKAKAAIWDD